MTKLLTTLAFAGLAAFSLSLIITPPPVSAQTGRSGRLHIEKDCPPSIDQGRAGDHCQIIFSNLLQIPGASIISGAPAANVYYDQAFGIPTGLLDSNVVLDAGSGNRAFGRCTLDFSTYTGLCTFSDGTGTLAGFTARADVTYLAGQGDGYVFAWDGTYAFNPLPPR